MVVDPTLPKLEATWRLLLVDDDPTLLRSMVRGLVRAKWNVKSAMSGEEALALLATEPIDVVISDMRMPGMDGAQLLEKVREGWPDTVRMIHSGQADVDSSIRALVAAHQFLSKPWHLEDLTESLHRIFALRAKLADPLVVAATTKVNVLPSQVMMLQRLQQAVASTTSSMRDLSDIVAEDVALASKLLQTVNTAFFSPSRRIVRIEEAVAYLGFATVRSLAQAVSVFSSFGASPELDQLNAHSSEVAQLARAIAAPEVAEEAFTVGLLHDVGLLVLSSIGKPSTEKDPMHSLVGAYLLMTWGLPWAVIEGVARHHEVSLEGTAPLQVEDAVAVAQIALAGSDQERAELEKSARLISLGVIGIIKRWVETARSH